ncbi:DUF4956 domain-containing protein [uncultured Dubosiella sp.]|uniref:DUF4956 domain-containing protein n=1 Tax=uncultured Dubosiella sp. TaxID=1937011 RepID=UPI00272FA41C|nr:DUF4956 domain-containing protein [uncultured Dubosiella sp.]
MFTSFIDSNALTVTQFATCLAASLFCGFVIAGAYTIKNTYSKNFISSIVLLPAIIQTIILLVNGNLGTGVAIMGAFSLVRFRSTPGTSKEMSTIFLAMAVGLATGMGQIGFALLFTAAMSALSVVLHLSRFGETPARRKTLKITMPETIESVDVFDSVLREYTTSFSLRRLKTSNLGSLFEAEYEVDLKKNVASKALIDDLRVCNGNLPISLYTAVAMEESL